MRIPSLPQDSQPRNADRLVAPLLALALVTLACTCGPLQRIQEAQATIGAVQATVAPALTAYQESQPTISALMTQMEAGAPGVEATLTAVAGGLAQDNLLHQWASSASASSQFGDPEFSPLQATGAPNVPQCDDDGRAWASADSSERATLTLFYDQPVTPVRISIIHSYYPTSVTQVEVVDVAGQRTVVVAKPPTLTNICPFTETFTVTNVTAKINTVIVTVDQAQIQSWDEIDAVELAGTP